MRPLTNIEDMLEKTEKIINNYPWEIVDNAYKWVTTELNWERVINMFINGFEYASPVTSCEGRIDL